MSRRRGRPPEQPRDSRPPALPVESGERAIEELLPASERIGLVVCLICTKGVPSIPAHLEAEHPTIRLEEYQGRFPTALLEPEIAREERKARRARRITVTEAEAAAHPCGADGAILEKNIAKEERGQFRRDCEDLLRRGYPPGYEVASVAHTMTLARRARLQIELVRDETDGEVYQSQTTDLLAGLEVKLEKGLRNLEAARSLRMKEATEDPLAALEAEMAQAEDWVRAHIGEFSERCPECGVILTPPALPHWAYEKVNNDQGVPYWPVWSAELWKLVCNRTIPLWVMAYTLRTSPEGLRFTARRKRTDWPTWIELEWEEQQLRTRLLADDKSAPAFAVDPARKEGSNGTPDR